MKNTIIKYSAAIILGVIVAIGLFTSKDDFANPDMFVLGVILILFYFAGIIALMIDELRKW
jgi:hypothetical protein